MCIYLIGANVFGILTVEVAEFFVVSHEKIYPMEIFRQMEITFRMRFPIRIPGKKSEMQKYCCRLKMQPRRMLMF